MMNKILLMYALLFFTAFSLYSMDKKLPIKLSHKKLVRKLQNKESENKKGYNCGICLDTQEVKEMFKGPCGHQFHSDCIRPWKELYNICPYCRNDLRSLQQKISDVLKDEVPFAIIFVAFRYAGCFKSKREYISTCAAFWASIKLFKLFEKW